MSSGNTDPPKYTSLDDLDDTVYLPDPPGHDASVAGNPDDPSVVVPTIPTSDTPSTIVPPMVPMPAPRGSAQAQITIVYEEEDLSNVALPDCWDSYLRTIYKDNNNPLWRAVVRKYYVNLLLLDKPISDDAEDLTYEEIMKAEWEDFCDKELAGYLHGGKFYQSLYIDNSISTFRETALHFAPGELRPLWQLEQARWQKLLVPSGFTDSYKFFGEHDQGVYSNKWHQARVNGDPYNFCPVLEEILTFRTNMPQGMCILPNMLDDPGAMWRIPKDYNLKHKLRSEQQPALFGKSVSTKWMAPCGYPCIIPYALPNHELSWIQCCTLVERGPELWMLRQVSWSPRLPAGPSYFSARNVFELDWSTCAFIISIVENLTTYDIADTPWKHPAIHFYETLSYPVPTPYQKLLEQGHRPSTIRCTYYETPEDPIGVETPLPDEPTHYCKNDIKPSFVTSTELYGDNVVYGKFNPHGTSGTDFENYMGALRCIIDLKVIAKGWRTDIDAYLNSIVKSINENTEYYIKDFVNSLLDLVKLV